MVDCFFCKNVFSRKDIYQLQPSTEGCGGGGRPRGLNQPRQAARASGARAADSQMLSIRARMPEGHPRTGARADTATVPTAKAAPGGSLRAPTAPVGKATVSDRCAPGGQEAASSPLLPAAPGQGRGETLPGAQPAVLVLQNKTSKRLHVGSLNITPDEIHPKSLNTRTTQRQRRGVGEHKVTSRS